MKNRFVQNALWAMVDKFVVLFGSLIAYVLVSKYLGPEKFGVFAFGVTISTLGVTISQWGANHVVFNLAVKNTRVASKVMFSSEATRLRIYVAFWGVSSLVLYFYLGKGDDFLILSLLIASHVFVALDVYQFYLEGSLNAKINARSNMLARALSTLLRVAMVFLSLKSIWFVFPYLINNLVIFFRRRCYVKKSHSHI
ncbi:hypothetical protein BZG72_15960, partial [Salinivibrio sp. PR6]|uniref:lipopolysaccharide biosynthesis protein n=1 Tax=Salinivibrio sp. PR6 TaxID=1909485 RepID=UPI0009D330E7